MTHFYRIPADVIQDMWMLCQENAEYAGRLLPEMDAFGRCNLMSTETYKSTVQNSSVQMDESMVVQTTPGCRGNNINVFYHTHPLSVVVPHGNDSGRYAPPSISDFFAHCVLGNYRNWIENRQMNTTAVMATEGLYVYTIHPTHFNAIADQIQLLFNNKRRSQKEMDEFEIGHLPMDIVKKLKDDHYAAVSVGYLQFVRDMNRMCVGEKYSIENGQFFYTMQHDTEFILYNAYTDALHAHGFVYDFYSAPFEKSIYILAG